MKSLCSMTSEEIIASAFKVTAKEAKQEIELHSNTLEAFQKEYGIKSHYLAKDILLWLGY